MIKYHILKSRSIQEFLFFFKWNSFPETPFPPFLVTAFLWCLPLSLSDPKPDCGSGSGAAVPSPESAIQTHWVASVSWCRSIYTMQQWETQRQISLWYYMADISILCSLLSAVASVMPGLLNETHLEGLATANNSLNVTLQYSHPITLHPKISWLVLHSEFFLNDLEKSISGIWQACSIYTKSLVGRLIPPWISPIFKITSSGFFSEELCRTFSTVKPWGQMQSGEHLVTLQSSPTGLGKHPHAPKPLNGT